MTRGRGTASIVASPVLVGAVTTLIVLVSVYLSYNANTGLPFVPTYNLKAQLPGGANLVPGNEVRIGGFRVGIVVLGHVPTGGGHVSDCILARLQQAPESLRALDCTGIAAAYSHHGNGF